MLEGEEALQRPCDLLHFSLPFVLFVTGFTPLFGFRLSHEATHRCSLVNTQPLLRALQY